MFQGYELSETCLQKSYQVRTFVTDVASQEDWPSGPESHGR